MLQGCFDHEGTDHEEVHRVEPLRDVVLAQVRRNIHLNAHEDDVGHDDSHDQVSEPVRIDDASEQSPPGLVDLTLRGASDALQVRGLLLRLSHVILVPDSLLFHSCDGAACALFLTVTVIVMVIVIKKGLLRFR